MRKYWKELLIILLALYILMPGIKERFAPCPEVVCITDTVYVERIVENPTIVYRDSVRYVSRIIELRDTVLVDRIVKDEDGKLNPVKIDSIVMDTVVGQIPVNEYIDTVDVVDGQLIGMHEVAGWLLQSKYRYYDTTPVVLNPPKERDQYFTISPVLGVEGLIPGGDRYGLSIGLNLSTRRLVLQHTYDVINKSNNLTVGWRVAGW